jgi:hypothetical protein
LQKTSKALLKEKKVMDTANAVGHWQVVQKNQSLLKGQFISKGKCRKSIGGLWRRG